MITYQDRSDRGAAPCDLTSQNYTELRRRQTLDTTL